MPQISYAPKPRYSRWEWFKYIAIRVIFPIVLLWDLIKFGVNKLLGGFISNLILPAQRKNFEAFAINDDMINEFERDGSEATKFEVITHDQAHLDTLEVKHHLQKNMAPMYQKYIINFVGNGMCYEHIIEEMLEDMNDLQANVVGFNLRGVGRSTGKATSSEDLVTDGIAQVQRLLDQGVSSQNITLKGHSLGAGIASLVAHHFHQQGQPINVFNSRSFSSITNFLVGHIRLKRDENGIALGQEESFGRKILSWLATPFIKLALALSKWEINAGSAFKSIPETHRDYIVVRSRKEVRPYRLEDMVIPHYASIHEALTSERHAKKAKIDGEIRSLDDRIQQADVHAQPQLINEKEALMQARQKIKNDRKMEPLNPRADGHNVGWSSMYNRSGKSAGAFFKEFVQRAEVDHAVRMSP